MSFAAPLFLIATLAGAIPILLHLINRQRAPVMRFSTLRFLRLSVQRTKRRKYVNDLLLLLLRVGALVAIAVGLAKPAISTLSNLLGSRDTTAMVIVLDNSASMGTSSPSGTRWETAVQVAEELLDELRDGDSAALVITCGDQRGGTNQLFHNHEVLRQSLSQCRLSSEHADLNLKLSEAQSLLKDSESSHKEIYLVSDMQAGSWDVVEDQDARTTGTDDPADGAIIVVDVFSTAPPNASVQSVELQTIAPAVGLPVQATVQLYGAADIPQSRHVELVIDGSVTAVSPVIELEADGTALYTFQFQTERPGLVRGEVRLVGTDSLASDDQYFFVLSLEPKVAVAIVRSSDQESVRYLDDTFYLEQALNPGDDQGWAIQPTILNASDLFHEPLSNYSMVYCVNLPTIEPVVANRLQQYVRSGGHVIWICGDEVDAENYNLANQGVDGDILPATIGPVRESPIELTEGWHIGAADQEHPVFSGLSNAESLYQSTRIYSHIEIIVDEDSNAKVLTHLSDGTALLVERPVGSGSVVLWGTSVHVDWTNLPIRPLFVPLFARLSFHLAGSQSKYSQLVAGTPAFVPFGDSSVVQLARPSGEVIQIERKGVDDNLRYGDTHDRGVYQTDYTIAGVSRSYGFASNTDTRESDRARVEVNQLESQFGRRLVVCKSLPELPATIARLREGTSLWELFLSGVLIILVVEGFVANRWTGQPAVGQQVNQQGRSKEVLSPDLQGVFANLENSSKE